MNHRNRVVRYLIAALLLTGATAARGEMERSDKAPRRVAVRGEKLDLKAIQKEYWDNGAGSEVEAVQKRRYTKAGKFHVSLLASTVSTDPFLSVVSLGASIGYSINELWTLNAIYMKDFVSASSAEDALRSLNGLSSNTNEPRDLKLAEVAFYPLYGKLSLLGSGIVYFDTCIMLGAGVRKTETGESPTVSAGLGAQLYLSRAFALRLDYRLLYFKQQIVQKSPASQAGTDLGTRAELSGITTLGISTLFSLF